MPCNGGDFKFFNSDYSAQCSICNKAKIENTVQHLKRRISQHRSSIQSPGTSTCINRDDIDDTNTLSAQAIKRKPVLILLTWFLFKKQRERNNFSLSVIKKVEDKESVSMRIFRRSIFYVNDPTKV